MFTVKHIEFLILDMLQKNILCQSVISLRLKYAKLRFWFTLVNIWLISEKIRNLEIYKWSMGVGDLFNKFIRLLTYANKVIKVSLGIFKSGFRLFSVRFTSNTVKTPHADSTWNLTAIFWAMLQDVILVLL